MNRASPTSPAPSPPALDMIGVTVTSLRDAEEVVLEGVNWTVEAGEFWVVTGLMRSGKSDLMALAAGITRPASGIYRVFGEELLAGFEQERLALRLRLGLVFDGGQLLHHLTLAENIALPLRYHRGDAIASGDLEQRVESLLAFTGLDRYAQELPAQVNRNWQQRIGLARALALSPEVLLLDSPLTGLDPRDTAWWIDRLCALAAGHPLLDGRPATLVVTGDNLEPWAARAARFAVLKDRGFVDLGTRQDLAGLRHPLLQELLPPPAPQPGQPALPPV